jgi:hypothetical protein
VTSIILNAQTLRTRAHVNKLVATSVVPPFTAAQSYSQVIRDTLFAKTVVLPFYAGFKARRSKQLPIQEPILPYLGVYIISEDMPPDGDDNAGEIRFIHLLRVGWQVIIENNDPVATELKLDKAFWAIMSLWTDAKLTNMWRSDMVDNTLIEGVTRGSRRHAFGNIGSTQQPIAELEYIATVKYRTSWPALVTDTLDEINVQVVPLAADGTVPPPGTVQRIIMDYEFTST